MGEVDRFLFLDAAVDDEACSSAVIPFSSSVDTGPAKPASTPKCREEWWGYQVCEKIGSFRLKITYSVLSARLLVIVLMLWCLPSDF
jgi:hypothetical protein